MKAAVAESEGLRISPKLFLRLSRYITDELGVKMPEAKLPLLESRLLRRVRELGFNSFDQYGEYLFTPPHNAEERVHFVHAVTTHKTDFFREPQHFDYLANKVLPPLVQQNAGMRITVWSAGCSSGEEPYTLAMVLSESRTALGNFDFAILATDISTTVLEKAREAIYPAEIIEPIPPALRRKYLMRSRTSGRDVVRVVPALRQHISFHRLNFMDDDYSVKPEFDAIFFRNVMIYFDRPTQAAVITKLCRNLKPGGYLFIGHTESLAGLDVPAVAAGPAIFRKPFGGLRFQ